MDSLFIYLGITGSFFYTGLSLGPALAPVNGGIFC
jgi:hypothetical protein